MITQSVDNIVVATEAAFLRALLVTRSGSIIPSLIMFTISPVTTFIPSPSCSGQTTSIPALFNIVSKGTFKAALKTSSPGIDEFNFNEAFSNATPPPGTIPSFIAALVAQIASSTLSCFSFNSTSELAPTLTTATLAHTVSYTHLRAHET